MEIINFPINLKNDSIFLTNCVCCNSILEKKVENVRDELIYECGECRYDDRPFAMFRSNRGPCTCEWSKKDVLYIICNTCISPTCIKCGHQGIYSHEDNRGCIISFSVFRDCSGNDCSKAICNICLSPPCAKCNKKCILLLEDEKNNDRGICEKCFIEEKKEKFKQKWNGSIKDKLECYGDKKLKILARNKNLKGRSKLSRIDLIDKLEPLTTLDDFPIR